MRIVLFFLAVLFIVSCSSSPKELKPGIWRGVLELQGQQLPFLFDVEKQNGQYKAYLRNDTERILLDEIAIDGDSVFMTLHVFDASLRAKINGDQLTGTFYKNYAPQANLPFSATWGDDYLFTKEKEAKVDFTGKYQVTFFAEKDTLVSVGFFNQKENRVTGSFLLTSGDYRFLEGNVVNDELKLSTFDGNHAYLFYAKKSGDTLRGDYYSGKTNHETWIGIKNENAVMPDLDAVTYLKPGYEKLDFSFPDLNGQKVSPSDERFRNKVLILQIFGTWCPNCMDETKFLSPWYDQNKQRGVEILGIAYERKVDFEYAKARILKMKQKWNVNYDFVVAPSTNDKDEASLTLPMINKMMAFPTTIFIGKDGKVKKIHTGFSGPGTGIYYQQLIQDFNETVNELLNEKSASSIE
jgi:peroxiredoxin